MKKHLYQRSMKLNICTVWLISILLFNGSLISNSCVISAFPWTEGFEELDTLGAGVVPPCWATQYVSGSQPNWRSDSVPEQGGVGAHTGTHFMYSTYSSNAWLFTPGMQLTGGNTYYFSFYYALTSATSGFTITTAVGNAQNDTAMTTVIGTLANPLNVSYKIAYYSYTPSNSGVYYFGINSNASNPPWYFNVDDVSLTTSSPCTNVTIPWTEGFEGISPTGANDFPPCWTTQLNSGTDWASANAPLRNGVGAHTGTNYLYSHWSSDTWLFTPGMQLTGGTDYYFTYYYAASDAIAGYTITTAMGTAQDTSAMATTLGTLTNPVNTNYEQAVYPFTPPSTGVYYFGIHSSATDPPYYFNIDDVGIQTNSCAAPTPTTATNVGSTSAEANWTCSGCTGSYILEYGVADSFTTPGVTDTAGPGGTVINVSAGNFSTLLSGLTTATEYRYFVRQNCGAGAYSVNYGSQVFSTGYCSTGLYTTGCTDGDYINNFSLSNLNQTGSGCSTGGYGDFSVLEPAINLTAGATYTWKATYGYPSGEYLKIWIDFNDNGLLDDPGELVFDGTLTGSDLDSGSITIPSSAPAGNHRLRVRDCYNVTNFGPCGEYGNGEGEVQDYTCNISIPACTIPSSSAATEITFTSAQANWTCFGGCTGNFILEYGPSATFITPGTGATPGANGTVINVTSGNTSAVIAGLAPGAQYTYYVRENCSGAGNGYSLNSEAQAFTTIGTITAKQQINEVPPGTTGVSILSLELPISGNIAPLTLNSVKITSENTSDADIASNGVKLWTGTATGPATQIGTSQTFSSGTAFFPGINLSLVTGTTYYFWLTYDISSTATLLDVVDAKINAGDISFTIGDSSATLPDSVLNPAGNVQIGYCTSLYTTGCADGDYINDFTLSNLSHLNAGCSGASNTWNAGYGDYSTSEPVINFIAGATYTWTATYGYPSGEYLKIWIDLNNNGVFTDSGELIYDGALTGPNVDSGSFTISAAATTGNHRLRVRDCYNVTDFGPCGQYGNGEGEVQDYTCNITAPECAVPSSVSASNITLTSAQANWTCTVCTGSYIVEYGPSATFIIPGTGATAGANGTVINVASGTDSVLITGLIPGVQYTYYVRENCSGSGNGYSLNSAPQNFTTPTVITVGTIAANQQFGQVPPGTSGVNILQVVIPVTGTIGTLTLNSITFTSENTNDADINVNGVKLWMGTAVAPTAQITSPQTFSSGAVTFSGLNMNLADSTYYLWLTYDISPTAALLDAADAKINAGDILFSATGGAVAGTQPPSLLDPAGNVEIGYCTSLYTTGCADGDYINDFTLSNLNQLNSGCSGTSNTWDAGYGDFTVSEPTINLISGDTYTWTATYGYPSGEYLKIWIDLNNNGVFTDSGELIYNGTITGYDLDSGSFMISATANPGIHRMRVRDCYGVTNFGPCGQYGNGEGEVQDYTVDIIAPNCPVPTSVTGTNIGTTSAQANWTCNGCTGSCIVEYGPSATFTMPGSGDTAGTNGTIIGVAAGADSVLITGLSAGTPYTYYVRQNCTGSSNGYSGNSSPQNFTTGSPLTFGTVIANQQTGSVPAGTDSVNILRVDLPVTGTIGALTLNSITFTSENTNDSDIAAGGVLLWAGTTIAPITQIGTGQSFSSGTVTFSNLGLNLPADTTYLWLSYNISPSATPGDTADAEINTGDINITASAGAAVPGTVPASPLNPAGGVIITSATCSTPVATGASDIGLTSFQVNWTCTGCTGSYIVEYGPSATFTIPGTGNNPGTNGIVIDIAAGTDSVLITGLQNNTRYTYYVRQICPGPGNTFSENSGAQNATTLLATGITGSSLNGTIGVWSNENEVFVDFTQVSKVDAQIDIFNILGQLISSEKFGSSSVYIRQITNVEAAYLGVRVNNNGEITTRKVFIANIN